MSGLSIRRGRRPHRRALPLLRQLHYSKIDKNRPLYRHDANTEGDIFCFLRPGFFPLGFLAFHLAMTSAAFSSMATGSVAGRARQ